MNVIERNTRIADALRKAGFEDGRIQPHGDGLVVEVPNVTQDTTDAEVALLSLGYEILDRSKRSSSAMVWVLLPLPSLSRETVEAVHRGAIDALSEDVWLSASDEALNLVQAMTVLLRDDPSDRNHDLLVRYSMRLSRHARRANSGGTFDFEEHVDVEALADPVSWDKAQGHA